MFCSASRELCEVFPHRISAGKFDRFDKLCGIGVFLISICPISQVPPN